MNRYAIIIESSNVKGQTDLPGARADASNWVAFLKSPLGGSWSDNEIKVFNKPTGSEITAYLTAFKDHYCFVCFSGHGEHSALRNQTVVCLNDNEQSYSVENLKPKGAKGTLIVDACRGTGGQRRVRFEKRAATISLVNESNAMLNRQLRTHSVNFTHQVVWAKQLEAAISGVVTMYSCAVGESAGEYDALAPAQGGFYSLTLIAVAEDWNRRAVGGSIYSTKNAHDDTVIYFNEKGIGQHPEYSPSWIAHPFAVAD